MAGPTRRTSASVLVRTRRTGLALPHQVIGTPDRIEESFLSTLTAPPRSVGVPGRALATLVALVAGLGVAFVLAPPWLAASEQAGDPTNQSQLVAAFRAGVVAYWRSGDSTYPPQLQRVVDYWFRFHLVKGGIAALLLIVLVALAVLLWRTYLRTDGLGSGGRAALVTAGAAVPA